MAEYIERKALRDALYDADAITMSGVKILNQFPVADVAPVRHGEWEIVVGSNGNEYIGMHLLPCKPRPNRGIYLLPQLRRKNGRITKGE